METGLVKTERGAVAVSEAVTAARIHAKAEATWEAYAKDWRAFSAWCEAQGLAPLAATSAAVCEYLVDQAAALRASSLERQLAGIGQAFTAADKPNPCRAPQVRETLKGIRRLQAAAAAEAHQPATRKKTAATSDILKAMVRELPDSLQGKRDRALVLLGMAGAFRRSELAALDVADIQPAPEGLLVTVRTSKTDQEGKGLVKPIANGRGQTCPVSALREWMAAAGISSGPLFRPINQWGQVQAGRITGHGIALVVKRAAAAAGFDPDTFSGHSLRAGMATQAARGGAHTADIMRVTGHKSERIVHGYIREGRIWQNSAVHSLGL